MDATFPEYGFTPAERRIYAYRTPDGHARWADPLEVQCDLEQHSGGKLRELWDRWCRGDELARTAAAARLGEVARSAFDLPDFDRETGQGCTLRYLLDLLEHFFGYLEGKD